MKVVGSSSINRYFAKQVDKIASTKVMKSECNKGFMRPESFAAAMMVTSIVSKDLVGCVIYTTQSWNNKKIPEKKRKFVAMTDLMNGIVMVGGQFLAGKIIEKKWSPKIIANVFTGETKRLDKVAGKMVGEDLPESKAPYAPNNIYKKYVDVIKNNKEELLKNGFNVNDKDAVESLGKDVVKKFARDGKAGKAVATGFGIIITALGTTALVKRTLAPFVSTPMASAVKRRFIDPKDAAKAQEKAQEKADEKPEQPLDHTVAPWNYENKDGDKVTINKVAVK